MKNNYRFPDSLMIDSRFEDLWSLSIFSFKPKRSVRDEFEILFKHIATAVFYFDIKKRLYKVKPLK